MGPVEVLFFSIGAVIVLIGLARGYVRELGVTLVVIGAIFILSFAIVTLDSDTILAQVAQVLGVTDPGRIQLLQSTLYSLILVVIVFASYAGRTLDFPGKPAPPPQGTLISLGVGLLNAYLIAGTLWFFQYAYNYPIRYFINFRDEFSPLAQYITTNGLLPPMLFENPVYWAVPLVILLFLRVRG